MPYTITMPKLSPTMEEGLIAKWHKKEGDFVDAGALLMEVTTDKATVEYDALDEGYLRKILVKEGGMAKINQPIAIFTIDKEENIDNYIPEGEEVPMPKVEEKKEKVAVKKEVTLKETPGLAQPTFVPEPPLEKYTFPAPSDFSKSFKSSPLARRLAEEKGLDLTTVKGSGPGGRVMSRDIDKSQPDAIVAFSRREAPSLAPGTYEEIPLTPMRKAIGKRLQESKSFIPHFYLHQEIDVTSLFLLREQLIQFHIKPTFNDFVIRACALSLRHHPEVNSGFHSVNQTIISFKTVDIGIGVAIDGGLITPIIRHADYLNIGQISVEVKELVKRAKEGKLDPSEYRGGSFTISNLGMYGITDFTAVINPPQAAILAVGAIEEKPKVVAGNIQIAKMMKVTLSCDHRVIDGATGAKFLKTAQTLLENPAVLLV